MPFFRRKPTSRAHIHYITPHLNRRGHKTKPRWHVDIVDAESGALLFVCPPRGYSSAEDARAAVDKIDRCEVVMGRRPDK